MLCPVHICKALPILLPPLSLFLKKATVRPTVITDIHSVITELTSVTTVLLKFS